MKFLFCLSIFLSSVTCFADPLWTLSLGEAKPKALFFSPRGEIFLSSQNENDAEIVKISLDGKILEKSLAKKKGQAGVIRAMGENIYWVVDGKLWILDYSGKELEGLPLFEEIQNPHDIAIDRDKTIYLASRAGVYRYQKNWEHIYKGPAQGLFLLVRELFVLRPGKDLLVIPLEKTGKEKEKSFSCRDCRWLERNSAGDWLSVRDSDLLLNGKKILWQEKSPIGRFAYIFQKDTQKDFIVLPLPEERSIKAIR